MFVMGMYSYESMNDDVILLTQVIDLSEKVPCVETPNDHVH